MLLIITSSVGQKDSILLEDSLQLQLTYFQELIKIQVLKHYGNNNKNMKILCVGKLMDKKDILKNNVIPVRVCPF